MHAIGYMLGLVLFSIIPIQMGLDFDEVVDFGGVCLNDSTVKSANEGGDSLYSLPGVMTDAIASCTFTIVILVLPEILVVNKKSLSFITVVTAFIVMTHNFVCNNLIGFPQHSMMNPIANGIIHFGSWMNEAKVGSTKLTDYMSFTIAGVDPFTDMKASNLLAVPLLLATLKKVISPTMVDHFAGTVVGALVGGTLVNTLLPDDPGSWKNWRSL